MVDISSTNNFKIHHDSFEGPLDLLLSLIEKRKFFINDISLAQVADDYLEYTKTFEQFPMRDAAEFLPAAATLILIKSRSLLPSLKLNDDEAEGVKNLEARLKLYAFVRECAKLIKINLKGQRQWQRPVVYKPDSSTREKISFVPGNNLSAQILSESIGAIIARIPEKEERAEVSVAKRVSLEERIAHLTQSIEERIVITFKELSGEAKEKYEIVVNFLALLELVKRGNVVARQESNFNNIDIEMEGMDTPKYV